MKFKFLAAAFVACALVPAAASAAALPAALAPAAPFPQVLQQAPTIEEVAPGVTFGEYALNTALGPIVARVIAIEPRHVDVKIAEVQAHDTLESRGETVGSMARRTGAVAGINGDYFDIGNTNRPMNIVVRNGVLLQMPRNRYALAIERDGTARIAQFAFTGQVEVGEHTASLDAVDQRPPDEGTSLITPEYGSVPSLENVTLVALQPLGGTPPLTRYRVTSIADNLSAQAPGYYLAIGPGALNTVGVPNPGDVVVAGGDLSPIALDDIAAAIGGGPLILHDGAWFDDPSGPNGGEFDKRIPCSGAAIASDGRVFLVEVDGRQPSLSVGLTRHEFAALLRALGAVEAMAFDGGGSSTLVVRRPGDTDSAVANSPSDRIERPVGNGLFVYSTAPLGPPVRLVARPGIIRAVSGAAVPIRIAALDAANHPASAERVSITVEPQRLGSIRDGTFYAGAAGSGRIALHSAALSGTVAIDVQASPARLSIEPPDANVDNGGTIRLSLRAADGRGYPLALPSRLAWSATNGSIDSDGLLRANMHNARVAVRVGGASADAIVTVGSHDVTLPFAERARFETSPRGGAGSLNRNGDCGSCVTVAYAFAGNERAAYAMTDLALPKGSLGISFDVLDDGSASRLRVLLRNTLNEDVRTETVLLDTPGWRRVVLRFPPDAQAAHLIAIYVLPPNGMQLASGQIELRNVRAVVAGN